MSGKLTIANTATARVRDNGRLRCDCGTRLQARDYEVETDRYGIATVRLVCPGCHRDLVEVEAGPC